MGGAGSLSAHPSPGNSSAVQHSMNMLYMDSLQRGDQCSPGRTSAWWSLFIWESSRFATYKKYVIQLHTRCRNRSVNFRMIFEKKHSYDPRMLWKIWGSWEIEARMGGTFPHGESFWPLLYVSLLLFFSNNVPILFFWLNICIFTPEPTKELAVGRKKSKI